MKFIPVNVRRSFRRGRRRARTSSFRGPSGWTWDEINLANSRTTVDNQQTAAIQILSGETFAIQSQIEQQKPVIIKRCIGQLFGQATRAEGFTVPWQVWDVCFALCEFDNVFVGTPEGFSVQSLQGLQAAESFRILWHRRVCLGIGIASVATEEGLFAPASIVSFDNQVDFDITMKFPIKQNESLVFCVAQAGSELYADGDSGLFQGYIRTVAQEK